MSFFPLPLAGEGGVAKALGLVTTGAALFLSPLPLAGEGKGEGGWFGKQTLTSTRRPSPQPSPKGRGSKPVTQL